MNRATGRGLGFSEEPLGWEGSLLPEQSVPSACNPSAPSLLLPYLELASLELWHVCCITCC